MSLSHDPEPDDRELVRYVLGLLPDEQAVRLDEASIAGDQFAARLRTVEDDLIDGYVRGTLDAGTKARFESYYLASPRRRARVDFATKFIRAIDREAARVDAAAVVATAPTHDVHADVSVSSAAKAARSRRLASLMAVAAAVVIVTGALLVEVTRLRTALTIARQESVAQIDRTQTLERQLAEQRAAAEAAVEEAARIRDSAIASRTSAPPVPNRGTLPYLAPPVSLAAELVLSPQTRATGPMPTLVIPAGADRVAVELRLESNDAPRYQVGLRDPATQWIVWRSGAISPTVSRGGSSSASQGSSPAAARASASVIVELPTSFLKSQHYSLDLTVDRSGSGDVVGSYTFRAVRQ